MVHACMQATVEPSRDGRQLQAAAAATPATNVYVNGRTDGAYGDSSWCQHPRRTFTTVTTARNTRQKVIAFTPSNQCGVQFYRKQFKYLALRPYASLTMLLNGGSVGGQAPLLVRSRLACWLPRTALSLNRLSSVDGASNVRRYLSRGFGSLN